MTKNSLDLEIKFRLLKLDSVCLNWNLTTSFLFFPHGNNRELKS